MPKSLQAFVLVALSGLVACGGAPPDEQQKLPDYPGTLVDTSEMGPDFLARQRVTFTRGETESSMTAVVQKRGDELVLLALTPFGSRAFMIRQRGVEFEVQSFVPQPFPVPPRFVLLDVHRVNFMRAARAPIDGKLPDGRKVTVEREGERIEEHWLEGVLRERRFFREDQEKPIVVRYDIGSEHPGRVVLENGWLRYRLQIETLERSMLE